MPSAFVKLFGASMNHLRELLFSLNLGTDKSGPCVISATLLESFSLDSSALPWRSSKAKNGTLLKVRISPDLEDLVFDLGSQINFRHYFSLFIFKWGTNLLIYIEMGNGSLDILKWGTVHHILKWGTLE